MRTGFGKRKLGNGLLVYLSSGSFCAAQRFSLLDKDQDGHLTEDDVISVPTDVVDEAFGQTPPGEVSVRNEFCTR